MAHNLVESVRARGRVVPFGAAAAVGRFQPNGPIGYHAVGWTDAPIRATRIEAMADWCERYASPDGAE